MQLVPDWFHHSNLPAPLNLYVSWLILEHIPNADVYLLTACILLTALTVYQLRSLFARPPPVPLKTLPRRPALQILFKPDETNKQSLKGGCKSTAGKTTSTGDTSSAGPSTTSTRSPHQMPRRKLSDAMLSIFRKRTFSVSSDHDAASASNNNKSSDPWLSAPSEMSTGFYSTKEHEAYAGDADGGRDVDAALEDDEDDHLLKFRDELPDSFAPLLSSSHVEYLLHSLTADLIHAVQFSGGVKLRGGNHEIPLDKDPTRPQLTLEVPTKTGCRLSAHASVGSDGMSVKQDFDVNVATTARSHPMVKTASIELDPPLPLSNVAPTLIHFPTLFEDKNLPHLRRIQIVRLAMDLIISFNSLLEKFLWMLECGLQIHLAKVQVTPLFKGTKVTVEDDTGPAGAVEDPFTDGRGGGAVDETTKPMTTKTIPEWRLSLAFSGHLHLFGWIPIPFISVTLPSFIIPQPHALLTHLMTPEPLASAKLRRENIAEKKIAVAILDSIEKWNTDVKAVATPPALGVDITLPGGVAVAVELLHGKDAGANLGFVGRSGGGFASPSAANNNGNTRPSTVVGDNSSINSMSSWTTIPPGESTSNMRFSPRGAGSISNTINTSSASPPFDANKLIPWCLEVSAKGSITKERVSLHVIKCNAHHENTMSVLLPTKSRLSTSGSLAIWKANLAKQLAGVSNVDSASTRQRRSRYSHIAALAAIEDESSAPSVSEMLLFPQEDSSITSSLSRQARILHRTLEYDYAFDIWDDTQLDCVTLSVGASHPMLNGGTMVTSHLESIYALGSVTAREGVLMEAGEWKRKRNILKHLPAVDFTFGIQNAFIPSETMSYTDDGQTRCFFDMEGGRMMVRIIGGIEDTTDQETQTTRSGASNVSPVADGIKVVADLGLDSLTLNSASAVKEFPELEIYEGTKLMSLLACSVNGRVSTHLRPQKLLSADGNAIDSSVAGPNKKNPLEAYEIGFTGSKLSFRIKESTSSLGHRRIIVPTETAITVKIVESVVDMSLEGNTKCELSWDFQGLSPMLQTAPIGMSPADADHEQKKQVSLLITPLRQGRLNFDVSAVGGLVVKKAATVREDREGLYDWKFFNAIISPDESSADRLLKVVHDKRTMEKVLNIIRLINEDFHKVSRYILTQVWRAKEIFDQEDVTDAGHAIPSHKMARLISLFLCGDVSETDVIQPLIRRVVNGDGLDIAKVKDLLRLHLDHYDDWAPELDRAVRWAAVMFGPMAAPQPYVEASVPPLSQLPQHAMRFAGIPAAKHLYEMIQAQPQLPLEASFSNLVSQIAPYLSFRQVEYFLQVRSSTDWQPTDLKRLRYVYSVKKKVLDISESYGGLSFLPQSFLVSVFLGEATRASLRVSRRQRRTGQQRGRVASSSSSNRKMSTLTMLRRRRMQAPHPGTKLGEIIEAADEDIILTPAARAVASAQFAEDQVTGGVPIESLTLDFSTTHGDKPRYGVDYDLGDSLLGPQDVAVLLQAGLTSAMKSSTVVQLNQRMLLDLIASQPKSFAVAVLAEIGTPGGHGSTSGLTAALMALLELDQSSFKVAHRLDVHALLESWLPGFKIPRRDDYMAGGRWARQSYYEAIYSVAKNILEDAECYMALKGHIQRTRWNIESDPLPQPKEFVGHDSEVGIDIDIDLGSESGHRMSRHGAALALAKEKVAEADSMGLEVLSALQQGELKDDRRNSVVEAYRAAFDACAKVLEYDKIAFQADWFKDFYRRNYDALMIKSVFDNVMLDVDDVRNWLQALRREGVLKSHDVLLSATSFTETPNASTDQVTPPLTPVTVGNTETPTPEHAEVNADDFFIHPGSRGEQEIVDAILDAIIFQKDERETLRSDPLVRLLIPNPDGHYDFTIVSAMGVITEGKRGLELKDAFARIKQQRNVSTIRADTGTARSFEFNAAKIEDAIESANKLKKPYGLLGYSQGCANILTAESILLSGSPIQRKMVTNSKEGGGLICRQLLFSAANGTMHGACSDAKVQRLIVMCEEFFKYQQGYFSRALTTSVLELLSNLMDSAPFQKFLGGAQSMLPEGCRAFWRESQHMSHVPTCTLRAVMEKHTTPESLEMISNLLTKQAGSPLHDSQVHVYDAVAYPMYILNRNGRVLKACSVGEGAIQRTHHWSPLSDEVEMLQTKHDVDRAMFACAKDRHIFPWVDVNVRFGFIKYAKKHDNTTDETPVTETAAKASVAEK